MVESIQLYVPAHQAALTDGDEVIVGALGRGLDYDEAAKLGMSVAITSYLERSGVMRRIRELETELHTLKKAQPNG